MEEELTDLPFFRGLSADDIALLKGKLISKKFAKGSSIFFEGQETDGLYLLLSGQVKVFVLHTDGREKTLAILSEGDILGEMTLFGSRLRSASVEAMADAAFIVIPRADAQCLLQQIPMLKIKIIELLSGRLRRANQQIQELAFYNARSRVILNLLELAAKYGKDHAGTIRLNIRLTHAELAKLAGVSRETMTKVLNGLQEQRLIGLTDKHLEIVGKKEMLRLLL